MFPVVCCPLLSYVVWFFYANWYSGIFFFLCGQKEETRKNREHAPPSNKWAFRCLAAELAASPLRQSSPETTPKSLICYRRLPLSFAQLTPRHLSWKTREAVFNNIIYFWLSMTYNPTPTPPLKLRGGDPCAQVYCLNSLTPKLPNSLWISYTPFNLQNLN